MQKNKNLSDVKDLLGLGSGWAAEKQIYMLT